MALPRNYISPQNSNPSSGQPSLVIFLPNLTGGGAERSHINLAPSFVAAGFKVTFLLYRDEGVLRDMLPSTVRVVTLGGAHSLSNITPLMKFLQRERPDFLISNLSYNNVIAILAAALCRVRTKIIASEHSVLSLTCADKASWDWRYKILPWIYPLFIRHADAIVAVSEGVANALAANFNIPRKLISVIYNPVVSEDFEQKMHEPIEHPWLQPNCIPVFLGVGSFTPVKDFATLISAFATVTRHQDARLILLGDGPMRAELTALAENLGVADRVSMPGYQLNPLPYMHAATALVLSSRHEGFSNVLVEALSCGTKIISTDCPYGPGEILARGKFGRLVPLGNIDAMAEAMMDSLASPEANRETLHTRACDFSIQKSVTSYLQLLRGLMEFSNNEVIAKHDVVMVGQFPEDASLIKGGVQASTYGLAKALKLCGNLINSLKVLALPLKAKTAAMERVVDGIEATFLNAPYKFLASSTVRLPKTLRLVRSCRHPVIHVHGTGLFQAALCWIARWNRIPLAWTLHGITEKETLMRWRAKRSMANGARYVLYRFLERSMLRVTTDIIVDTPYVQEAIPPTRNRIHVIPQGIFMDELIPLRDHTRDPNLVLSLGVMAPRKGHHLLLEAFVQLRKKVPQARLVIAGALAIPDYQIFLEKKVRELGLSDTVELRINLPRTEILKLLGAAHIFALHSEEESQGIALCEALAVGLPIVATRVGGIPFVVNDGINGFLSPFNDVQAFADNMSRLLTDHSLHAQMVVAARSASAKFDWLNIAADVTRIYDLAANVSGRAHSS